VPEPGGIGVVNQKKEARKWRGKVIVLGKKFHAFFFQNCWGQLKGKRGEERKKRAKLQQREGRSPMGWTENKNAFLGLKHQELLARETEQANWGKKGGGGGGIFYAEGGKKRLRGCFGVILSLH